MCRNLFSPVCRDKNLRGELMKRLASFWSSVISCKLDEDVNEVVFASSCPKFASKDQARKSLAAGFKLVNDHVKKALQSKEELIDMQNTIKKLNINR
jgi:hypothetical protein